MEAEVRDAVRFLLTFILLTGLISGCTPSGLPTPTAVPTEPPPPSPLATPALPVPSSPEPESYRQARQRMVDYQIRGRGVQNEAVLSAMLTVPRHEFVPEEFLDQAYADHPLPIGHGQTISQPYIVALMTELLEVETGDKVLEIGTGSGYQAAILAQLTDQVYSVEIIEELAVQAEDLLQRLNYTQVRVLNADGYYGWEEHAPFDAIIVTCAPDHVPQPLVRQLKDGGRMVIPVGPPGGYQSLWLIVRQGEEVKMTNMGGVAFVPLTGEH
ncbi:MAG: protein-L-isoaspartate(D-aspartate) O-methyltransferase [Chloroflexota bacterium]|nr:protein-L-isoaspartate(D-aspartate) O-methyltransferase [Chloroflexota bacterium]